MKKEFIINENPEMFLKEVTDNYRIAISDALSEQEAFEYVEMMLRAAKPCKNKPEAWFIMFDEPSTIESDCRVAFVFEPTYMVAGSIMFLATKYESVLKVSSFYETFEKLLNGCMGRNFMGHGCDDIEGFLKAMTIFAECNVRDFLDKYGKQFSVFNEFFQDREKFLVDKLIIEKIKDSWTGETYEDSARQVYKKLYSYMDRVNVFVYGTLMRGERAHNNLMQEASYLGDYILPDFAMYDLGSFPGIRPCKGEQVLGELFSIPKTLVKKLDAYEGEGHLYTRKEVLVGNEREDVEAYVYVYNDYIDDKPMRRKWNINDNDYVYYACYGSNLDENRFRSYIEGGLCEANGVTYSGCRNEDLWLDDMFLTVSGEMYYGNCSSSWDGKGVSFYDHQADGQTVMRLYCITWGQLSDIQSQEGKSDNWYGRKVCLGMIDNTPIYTLTSEHRRPENEPSEKYLSLLKNALLTNTDMRAEYIDDYLLV